MADPKKDKPKEKPVGWNLDATESVIVLIFLLAILGSLVPFLLRFFTTGDFSFYGYKISNIFDFFRSNTLFFKIAGFSIAGGAALGTVFLNKMADAVLLEEKAKIYPADMKEQSLATEPESNPIKDKWAKIIALSESTNQSDWRLAIIEADIILDELLTKLQLPGNTMGDKLKAVEPSDFVTIEAAWEAHKARNMIAHNGSDFLINQREIRRIISLYESVFKEFHLI